MKRHYFLQLIGSTSRLLSSKLTFYTGELYFSFPGNKCYGITPDEREDCGYFGITEEECEEKRGCCFDKTVPKVPWCFKGNEEATEEPTEGSTEEPTEEPTEEGIMLHSSLFK